MRSGVRPSIQDGKAHLHPPLPAAAAARSDPQPLPVTIVTGEALARLCEFESSVLDAPIGQEAKGGPSSSRHVLWGPLWMLSKGPCNLKQHQQHSLASILAPNRHLSPRHYLLTTAPPAAPRP